MRSNKGMWLIQEPTNHRTGVGSVLIPSLSSIMFKYLALANCSGCTPGDVFASGSSLVLPRATAGTRGQYIIVLIHCTIQELAYYAVLCKGSRGGCRRGGEKEGRGNGKGRRKSLGLLVVRQQGLG
jgi:hypothetical protein